MYNLITTPAPTHMAVKDEDKEGSDQKTQRLEDPNTWRPKDPKTLNSKDPKTQRPDAQPDYCQPPHTWQSRLKTRRVGQLGQDKGDKEVNKEIVGKLAPSTTAYLSVSRISYKPLQKE